MYHLLQPTPYNPQIQQKTFQLQTPWKPIICKPKNKMNSQQLAYHYNDTLNMVV
jgi:hypothetical protein